MQLFGSKIHPVKRFHKEFLFPSVSFDRSLLVLQHIPQPLYEVAVCGCSLLSVVLLRDVELEIPMLASPVYGSIPGLSVAVNSSTSRYMCLNDQIQRLFSSIEHDEDSALAGVL